VVGVSIVERRAEGLGTSEVLIRKSDRSHMRRLVSAMIRPATAILARRDDLHHVVLLARDRVDAGVHAQAEGAAGQRLDLAARPLAPRGAGGRHAGSVAAAWLHVWLHEERC